jgi:bifunctional DNase/RNase
MASVENKEGFIKMSVGGLTLDPVTKTPIVVLKDEAESLNLPIWIGLLEATSMATELEGVKMARPMTHDLLRELLDRFGASVESIEVTELRENTFYAVIHIEIAGKHVAIDARPSDAISLALRTESPIYVSHQVLEASSILPRESRPRRFQVQDVGRSRGPSLAPTAGRAHHARRLSPVIDEPGRSAY